MKPMGVMEKRFADIVWDNAPISSPKLVEICSRELNWAKSTTYTVLKKLCDRGLFKNDNANVVCLMSRDDYLSSQSVSYVENEFKGSLPDFVAAFASGKRLKEEDVERIRSIIDCYAEGNK